MFRRRGAQLVGRFTTAEAQVLRQCTAELAAMLSGPADRADPVVSRLFPGAYPQDPVEDEQYRELTEDDLRSAKQQQAAAVLSDLVAAGGQVTLTEESADLWLRALTDLRLALGTQLGIEGDTDIQAEIDDAVLRDPSSARVARLTVYSYLSLLQESLVEALTSGGS